jgi:hypothetical protein
MFQKFCFSLFKNSFLNTFEKLKIKLFQTGPKSLAHCLCLKQQLYAFWMLESQSIVEQITKFNKTIDDLANIKVKFDDEDEALLLLSSLPMSYCCEFD